MGSCIISITCEYPLIPPVEQSHPPYIILVNLYMLYILHFVSWINAKSSFSTLFFLNDFFLRCIVVPYVPQDNFHLEGLGVWINVSVSEVVCLGLINFSLFSFKLSLTSFSPCPKLDFVNFAGFVSIHDFLWELDNPSTFISSHFPLSCASVDSPVSKLKGKL